MARFTKIPETNLPGMLGGLIGSAAGGVLGNATSSLSSLESKLESYSQKLSEGDTSICRLLDQLKKPLDVIDNGISAIEGQCASLKPMLDTIKIPITILKTVVTVIETLPLPQLYLVTAVSAGFATIVVLLSELIAQIEQIILTLGIVIDLISSMLSKIREKVNMVRTILTSLMSSCALQTNDISDKDRELLEEANILDAEGNDLFGKLRETDIIWIGDLDGIETGSLAVENQVKAAQSGTTIKIPTGAVGNYILFVYKNSKTEPTKPEGRSVSPDGWINVEPLEERNWWYSKGTVSGKTGLVVFWTEPKQYATKFPKKPGYVGEILRPTTRDVNVFRLDGERFKKTIFNKEEANAIILNASVYDLLDIVENTPIDPDLKDQFQSDINPELDGGQSGEDLEDIFVDSYGNIYKLVIRESDLYSKLATIRYVEALDSDGVVVYEGEKTFAYSASVLFAEAKVRLRQLLS